MRLTLGAAPLLLGLIGPSANSGFVIEDQTSRTHDHIELSVDAVIELVTDRFVTMGEITVQTWTMLRRLRGFCRTKRRKKTYRTRSFSEDKLPRNIEPLTQFGSLAAVDVEGKVALLLIGTVVVEDHTVGAELFGYFTASETCTRQMMNFKMLFCH